MEQSLPPDLFTDWFGCAKDKIKQKIRLSKKIGLDSFPSNIIELQDGNFALTVKKMF